jgi:hypothetical protein
VIIMDTLPPSIPVDFWPKVPVAASYRLPFHNILVEIPARSESHVLTALSSLIHQWMESAGEWAADAGWASAPIRDKSPQEMSRLLVENSARLLSVYEGIYKRGGSIGELDRAPEAVKASAISSYQSGFVNRRHCHQASELHHKDDLHNGEKTKPSGEGEKFHR